MFEGLCDSVEAVRVLRFRQQRYHNSARPHAPPTTPPTMAPKLGPRLGANSSVPLALRWDFPSLVWICFPLCRICLARIRSRIADSQFQYHRVGRSIH